MPLARFLRERMEALLAMAEQLSGNESRILEANKLDVANAKTLVEQGKMSAAYLKRLKLDAENSKE